jgi:hypothetical protein
LLFLGYLYGFIARNVGELVVTFIHLLNYILFVFYFIFQTVKLIFDLVHCILFMKLIWLLYTVLIGSCVIHQIDQFVLELFVLCFVLLNFFYQISTLVLLLLYCDLFVFHFIHQSIKLLLLCLYFIHQIITLFFHLLNFSLFVFYFISHIFKLFLLFLYFIYFLF